MGSTCCYLCNYIHILKKSKTKNLRILKLNNLDARDAKYDIKYLEGKVLVQDLNKKMIEEFPFLLPRNR